MKKNYSKLFNKGFNFLAIFCFIILSNNLYSQTNIALSATPTHSGGGVNSTGYGPSNYNDNVYNSYGSLPWGWVYTNGYIDYTWSTSVNISKVVFYKDNRPMTSCTVQYWNSGTSSWTTITSYSGSSVQDSVSFSPVSTTVLRLYNVAGSSNPNFREIKVFGPTAPKDAGISFLVNPKNPCGATSDPLIVNITNFGTDNIAASSAIAVTTQLSGTVSGTYTSTYNRALPSGKSDTIHVTNLNTAAMSGKLNVKSWARWSADAVYKNDTLKVSLNISGTPSAPNPQDVIKCGQGSVTLNAGVPAGTSAMWFNSSSSTTVLAMDTIYNTPFLYGGTTTYWVESVRYGANSKLSTGISSSGYWFGNTQSGNMFDITANKTLIIDSLAVNAYTSAVISANIYYRVGTYAGYQTNSSAWTLAKTVTGIQAKNIGQKTIVNMNGYVLPPGTYGIYVQISDGIVFKSGGNTYTNDDIKLTAGDAIVGNFSGVASNYTWEGEIYYRTLCNGPRKSVNATIKPSPYGAAFIKSTPFQSPQPNTNGFKNNPDIVAKGDILTFEVTPPTGYSNSGHGSTWFTTNLKVKTKSGRDLPSTYYTFTPNSSSGNGKLSFKADSLITDTSIIITLSIRDLGPYYCDSTITRYIFVAPRPVPDFKFNQPVCDGDAVLFDNLSTISTGGLKYRWDLGTGNAADTSDAFSFVFTFPTYGIYNVTLKTTSLPYGYVETKTISVVVTEIPKVGFKVLNACENVPIQFVNNTSIGAGSVTYLWDFGDPTSNIDNSTAKNPSWTYKTPGGYKVKLIATSNGCKSEMTKNANQFATPKASYTAPSLICDKSEVKFTNGSTIQIGNMGYLWDFGDGGISTFANPTHKFTNSSNKTVKLKTISEFGCTDSMTKTLTLQESPKADYTYSAACNLTSTKFTFTGTRPASPILTVFNWDFSGEGTTTVENPSKLFSIVGKKQVKLTLTSNNGCTDVITKEVNVKLQSKADFEASDVCDGDDAVFTNKSTVSQGNLVYNWKFGDTKTSNLQSPRHRYNIGGVSQTYNVTLSAIVPGGCSDSITKAVTVNTNPNSDFTFKTSGRLVYFTAATPGATLYQWRFGDGGSSSSANPQYSYIAYPKGKYMACLSVVNAANCFSETCKEIAITGSVDKITKLSGVKIYPNPNKGNFTITVEDPKADIAISIYNLLGEVVKTIQTSSLKSVYSIDLNEANGVYLVKVTNGGLTSTQKVTINK